MVLHFYKYQGAGNDFILIDNRNPKMQLSTERIKHLCDRHFGIGADGLILLEESTKADFKMIYFNSDGKESSMCGNGGRCIVAFAKKLSLIHHTTTFEAIDGIHYAEVITNNMVRLKMQDVSKIEKYNNEFVLNTGSPHFVKIVNDIKTIDVFNEGRAIRYSPAFCQNGINVNFIEITDAPHLFVRTYERGVENETLACGTGVTAAALVASKVVSKPYRKFFVTTLGGELEVEFEYNNNIYQNIFLTGNADFVFYGEIEI